MRALVILLFCFALSGPAGAEQQAKGWLGATVEDLSAADAAKLGMESPHGVKVIARVPAGPAENAGLEADDVILTLDRVEVENKAGFEADLAAKAPGTEIKLGLRRGASEKRLGVMLAAEPKPAAGGQPILQLDTGGHQAVIEGLAFTPDGKFLVSAGDDKAVRVWDWRRGKTVRTIRGQSGPGPEGTIYAIALSPDGRWLAVGGRMHPECEGRCGEIRLYDFASGELKALLKGHTNLVQSLVFSSDSKRLISGMSNSDAVSWDVNRDAIIWDVETQTLLQPLHGIRDDVVGVDFTPDGARAVTASVDKMLRLWRVADGSLIKEMEGHAKILRSLAISPKDGSIVSGDEGGEIRLWDGKTGAFKKVLAHQDGDIGLLRVSPDGRLLLSTSGRSSKPQRIYDVASGNVLTSYAKHGEVVIAGAFSPDGSLVATAGGTGNEIHVWDPKTGETKAVLKGTGQPIWAVGFSADGRGIAWGSAADYRAHNNRGALETAIRWGWGKGETLSPPEPVNSAEGWTRAQASLGAWSLRHRKGGVCGSDGILDIIKDGKPAGVSIERNSIDGCEHRTYSFNPGGNMVISGGNTGNLAAYGLDGKKIGDFVGHEGDVMAIAASPDGRYLVSGSLDQTVRLWNLQTREPIVTIFRGTDGEWVMWTPQGYYGSSPGADKIVGWQINRGFDKAADYVTAEQLRSHLNRPDIVAKAIQLASAEEAVRQSFGTEFKLSDLLARPAPHLRILSPAADSAVKTPGNATVTIALDATPDPVTRIRIQVNGRQLDDFLPQNGPVFEPGEHSFPVPLAKGKNTIVVTALNEIGWSKAEDGTLTLINQSAGNLDRQGTLYIIAIGVTKYPGIPDNCPPNTTCDLGFTGNDAIAFADTIEQRLGVLHARVVRRVLVNEGKSDGPPTAANIINELGILSWAQPNDTVAVFLAGHGLNDGPNYRFVSTDAAFANGMILPASVVPWYAIEEAIDGAKGRRLLFIDTCHSAGAYNQRLGNVAYSDNILAYSSARWDQLANESDLFHHGLFTQALVEGLSGKADLNGDGHVDTAELYEYLKKRVPELAAQLEDKPQQDPQFFKGRDAEVYTLAAFK